MQFDLLYTHTHLAQPRIDGMHYAREQAIGIKDGIIQWLGSMQELEALRPSLQITEEVHLHGQWALPGLIDCHTHLVYAGNRADEFAKRMQGMSYAQIAAEGGGILSTVHATRATPEDELYALALPRLQRLQQDGVTGIEIKSGYGLDVENELKLLRVIQRLKQDSGLRIHATLLAAHAVPPEYRADRSAYLDLITKELIPEAAKQGLADSVDAFCENIGFTCAETEQVFHAAEAYGLPVRLHAEQLSAMGGSSLAARHRALSVDHLEYLTEADAQAMAQSGTVAVLLPGAFYYLRETTKPPVDLLRCHNIPMAIATDHNPGTSPTLNLPLMLNMSCIFFGLTPDEALLGVTLNAARALGWQDAGKMEVGQPATFSFHRITHPHEMIQVIP